MFLVTIYNGHSLLLLSLFSPTTCTSCVAVSLYVVEYMGEQRNEFA